MTRGIRELVKRLPGIRRIREERDDARRRIKRVGIELGRLAAEGACRDSQGHQGPEERVGWSGGSVRVLHVNFRESGGGAAGIARTLVDEVGAPYFSRLMVPEPVERTPIVLAMPRPFPELERLVASTAADSGYRGFTSLGGAAFLGCEALHEAHLVHLHNLHPDYFNLGILPELCRAKPVIWTLHDEYQLTGHCASTMGCDGWLGGCAPCPHLGRYPHLATDTAGELFRRKRRVYQDAELQLVCPSDWMRQRVEKGMLGSKKAHVIPNGVDTQVFRPGDRAHARRQLGLPDEAFICFYAADGGSGNPFKGGRCVAGVVDACSSIEGLVFAEVGGARRRRRGAVFELGRMNSAEEMALCYQAADVFFYPTNADSFGLVVAEAMACGLPVVATRVDAIPELVEHERTGLLVERGDAEACRQAILHLMRSGSLRKAFGESGRERIVSHFSKKRMLESYGALYSQLVESWYATNAESQ